MTKKERAKLRRQRKIRRTVTTIALMVLTAVLAIGGTVAWLTAKTTPVTNTFTAGDINIDLDESENLDLKIVPGKVIKKDPEVTVKVGSEACWLFVKIEEKNWPDAKEADGTTLKVDYKVDDDWTALPDVTGVYYRDVEDLTAKGAKDVTFAVLKDNKVTVSENLTKTEAEAIGTPTLTFTAYACQKANVGTAADAWKKIDTTSGT